jgi:ABC-type branched-subunit amino acid transport system permease subunit
MTHDASNPREHGPSEETPTPPDMPAACCFALVAAAFLASACCWSWSPSSPGTVALTIFNMGLSAIMALGVNMQWGYAGLFNAGVMGFTALGGLAAVLVSHPAGMERPGPAGGMALLGLCCRDHRRRDRSLDRACPRDGCGRWR